MQPANRPAALALLALALFLIPSSALGAITMDTSQAASNTFQQTSNNPCVIGDPSCKEPDGMTYTSRSGTPGGGNGSSYDLTSPLYQAVSPHTTYSGNLIPTSFTIGVDENIAAGAEPPNEYLVAFITYVCNSAGGGCTIDADNSFQPGSPQLIPNTNNGNGYSDFTLKGFTLTANSYYKFEAKVSNDSDGMEEFFLIPTPGSSTVPEPMSILLLGTALSATVFGARKRFGRKAS